MISLVKNNTQPNIKVQNQQQFKNRNEHNNSNPNFKGAVELGTQVLNYFNTSPAVGACFIDFISMAFPRTMVDMSRSFDAGVETGIRESSGTINHALAGIIGLGAGYLVSSAFNKANGVKAHLMFMDGKSVDTFKEFVNVSSTSGGYDAKAYWDTFFKSLRGLNTTKNQSWQALSEESINKATEIMSEASKKSYSIPKKTFAEISELIIGETGAGSTYKVMKPVTESAAKVVEETGVNGSLKDLLASANSMFKAVTDKAAHDKTPVVQDLEKFLAGVKNRKIATVAAGLSVPLAIGMSVQPVNRYLTKKRTGSDGFVGVEGREPDHSTKFKLLKTAIALLMGSAMVSTILKNPKDLYTKFGKASKELLSELQYKGMVPTINQFKFIYGLTIMSRMFAARDKNEVRESAIKDSLGFANWLILGGFVSKLTAKAFNKGIVNYDENIHGKGTWNYIKNAVEKTHEEILYPTLKKLGIKTVGEDGKALPFRKLLNIMQEKAASQDATQEIKTLVKETSSRLKYKNFAQLAGYLYSCLVLGIGIPKLNIAITKHLEKKAAAQKNASHNDKMKLANVAPLQPESKTFSAFGAYLN